MAKLTHIDEKGAARMVEVGEKPVTRREAVAVSRVSLSGEAFDAICGETAPKGDVLAAARLAGIMAAKKTSDLIPLCHPLALTGVDVEITPDTDGPAFDITARVRVDGKTGVEMEALTAASVAALTLYDMAKALDRAMVIGPTRLMEKTGGASGTYRAGAGS